MICLDYTQIPGMYFKNNLSVVVHNVILKIILVIYIFFGLDIAQIDIEMIFLKNILSENEYIFWKCPIEITIKNEYLKNKKHIWNNFNNKSILD